MFDWHIRPPRSLHSWYIHDEVVDRDFLREDEITSGTGSPDIREDQRHNSVDIRTPDRVSCPRDNTCDCEDVESCRDREHA